MASVRGSDIVLRSSRLGMLTLDARVDDGARAPSPMIVLRCFCVQTCESVGSRARYQVAGRETSQRAAREGRQRSRSQASATGADAGNRDDPGLCEASLLRALVGQVWSKREVGGLRTRRYLSAEILQRERQLRFVKSRSLVTVRGRSGIEKVSRRHGAHRGLEVQLCHTRLGSQRQRVGEAELRGPSASTAAFRPSNKGA